MKVLSVLVKQPLLSIAVAVIQPLPTDEPMVMVGSSTVPKLPVHKIVVTSPASDKVVSEYAQSIMESEEIEITAGVAK